MQSPSRLPILAAVVAGLAVIAIVIVAVVTAPAAPLLGPDASASPSARPATAPPSNVVAIDPAVCALERAPGPDETPVPKEGEGGFDPTEWGIGRWRLCLAAPAALQLEGSAWCRWSEGRDTVQGLMGLDIQVGDDEWGGEVEIATGRAGLHRSSPTGPADYWSADTALPIDPGPDGRAGAVTLSLPFLPPADTNLPSPPADGRGTIRWSCGAPPPPRPGMAAGQLTLRLDAPVGREWTAPASCAWITSPTGPRLDRVTAPIAVDDLVLSMSIGPNARFPDNAEAVLTVTDGAESGDYASSGGLIPYRQAPDASSGILRLRGLHRQPDGGASLGGGIDEVSGAAGWECPRPATPGPPREDGQPPSAQPVPGNATIRFAPAVLEPIVGSVSCQISAEDPASVGLVDYDGTIAVGDRALLLHGDQDTVRLALVGADGWPAGEYLGSLTDWSGELLLGGMGVRAPVAFEPKDQRYVPLGGPAAPREISVEIDIACDLRQARVPGLTIGRLDLALASGIDRRWSVDAACSWRLRNGVPVVVQAVNAEPLTIGDQTFRAYGRPDLALISQRGARYAGLNASVIEGPVAADGSSGRLTFAGIGPRGRIMNVNDRLGGRDGVLKVDGTLSWTCGAPPNDAPPEPVPG